VKLPALGYRTLRAFYQGAVPEQENPFRAAETTVENGLIRLSFDPSTGELCGMTDLRTGKELLSGATKTVLVDETDSDTWAHGITEFKKEAETFSKGEIRVVESGPVRATVRTWQFGEHTSVRRDYCLTAGSDVVTVKTKVDFREHHRMLKFRFPTTVENPRVLCEIPFGSIERPNDGTEQVCHRWFAAADGGGTGGLAVLNDSKYSFDADGSVLSLTVLRGAIWADHFGARDEFCEYMDQGEHEFTYALMPFASVPETAKRAAELNQPPFAVLETFHKGTLPLTYSGVSVSEDNIVVTAVKKHEDSDAVVLRAYECEGRDTDVTFTAFGMTFAATFGHNTVKTFVLTPEGARETDFLEE
jgi:alpha-mannosidase